MAANLKPVPDSKKRTTDTMTSVNERATTTSFRIPIYLYNKVRDEAERLDLSLSRVYMRALTEYFEMFKSESWDTVDDPDVYDPSRFYTHSQDKHGHSVTVHVPIPKPLAAELANLANSGIVPAYRSSGDVIRDAIYHRTKIIARMVDNGELDVAVNMAMLMSDEIRLLDEAEQAEQLIDALRTNAQAIYARDGSTTRLKRYLAERRESADSIPAPYRKDYLSAIEDYEKRIEGTVGKKSRRKK